jgi:hypothetical protein
MDARQMIAPPRCGAALEYRLGAMDSAPFIAGKN